MSIQIEAPSYILGQSATAELRLELLNELTAPKFVEAMSILPNRKVRVLILGCGSGHLEARLSEMFEDSHFVGIDISAKRIEEAVVRTKALECSNTYEFIQADLTTLSTDELEPCDILISRFVLSHLSDGMEQFERFLPLVRPGGFVCLEEVASDGSEYFCSTKNKGYRSFVEMVDIQIKAQQSAFDTGFRLLSELTKRPGKVLHSHLGQAILRSARHKSILRLGLEEAKSSIGKQLDEELVEETISNLRKFEENEQAFGLYSRTLAVIAQTPEE